MKYISILRGINVSGQKNIKMIELKSMYESLGYQGVVTYIQSGNVIFSSAEESKSNIKSKIENAIEKIYGFHVPVEVTTRNWKTVYKLYELSEG